MVSTLDPAYVKKGFILGSTKTSSVFFEAIIDLLLILPILYILNNYKYRNVITKKTTMMFSWCSVLADWQQPGGSPTPTEVHLSRIIFPMISRDYRGDDNEKMMIRLINIYIMMSCMFVCLCVTKNEHLFTFYQGEV